MKIVGIALLALMLPALLGCATPDTLLAQRLVAYNAERYKDAPATGTLEDGVRTIRIKASQFYFEPETIVVNRGERVRIVVEAVDVPHGFEIEGLMIPGYDIETVIRPGFPLTLEFDAMETGVWDFICAIYCGFGHSTMKGTFVVR